MIRYIRRMVRAIWALILVAMVVASLGLSTAMTLFPAVLSAVVSTVELLTGRTTFVTEASVREKQLRADLDAERTARRQESAALRRRLAEQRVDYRGKRVSRGQAVRDTVERVSRRTSTAVARNLGSMAGEALPVAGAAVVVAATAWELHDSCELMKELRALDAAFHPDDPVSDNEVCGIEPPTLDMVWQAVSESPAAVWGAVVDLYGDLPKPSASTAYDWTASKVTGLWEWFSEPEPLQEASSLRDPTLFYP